MPPEQRRGRLAAHLIYYAEMTGPLPSSTLCDMEIRDSALHRSFCHPRSIDAFDGRSVRRMYGSCTTPVILQAEEGHAVDHERHVRCRNCPGCLRSRRFLWQMRAEAETLMAERTWFFTGTTRHQSHELEVVSEDCTKWLKRLRQRAKESAGVHVPMRYLLVPEKHKSGALHIHALIHCDSRITYRMVTNSWGIGFSDAKLSDYKAAGYVTKYVTKDFFDTDNKRRPRIRASRAPTYGGWIMERDPEIVQQLMNEKPIEDVAEVWRKNLKMAIREHRSLKNPSPERKVRDLMI